MIMNRCMIQCYHTMSALCLCNQTRVQNLWLSHKNSFLNFAGFGGQWVEGHGMLHGMLHQRPCTKKIVW